MPHQIIVDTQLPAEMLENMNYGHLPNLLPYTMQDGYNREKSPRDFRVAVLENDLFWGATLELSSLPPALMERLTHYFTTYKLLPGEKNKVNIVGSYERDHAQQVIAAALEDYQEAYGETPPTLRF